MSGGSLSLLQVLLRFIRSGLKGPARQLIHTVGSMCCACLLDGLLADSTNYRLNICYIVVIS